MDGVSKKATVTWVPDQQQVERRENMKISEYFQQLLDENFREVVQPRPLQYL